MSLTPEQRAEVISPWPEEIVWRQAIVQGARLKYAASQSTFIVRQVLASVEGPTTCKHVGTTSEAEDVCDIANTEFDRLERLAGLKVSKPEWWIDEISPGIPVVLARVPVIDGVNFGKGTSADSALEEEVGNYYHHRKDWRLWDVSEAYQYMRGVPRDADLAKQWDGPQPTLVDIEPILERL